MPTTLFEDPKHVTKQASPGGDSQPTMFGNDNEDGIKRTIDNIRREAETHRDQFATQWKLIEDQINCIPPAAWNEKEEWQTKIFIPEQFKISETASAMMMELLGFTGRRQFFTILGIDNDQDRQQEQDLVRFMMLLMNEGKFFNHNGFVLQEAINIGSSALKMLDAQDRTGIDYSYRSIIRTAFDPQAVVNFDDSRFIMEWFNVDIADVMADEQYTKEKRNELLMHLSGKTDVDHAEKDTLITITNAEGNAEFKVSNEYAGIKLEEFWGLFPVRKEVKKDGHIVVETTKEWRAITIADNQVILRNDKNTYGFIPYQWCRTKRRRNFGYGNGFCNNIVGLQDLSNSLVNLGFDSAKIKSLGIIKVDDSAVADPSSIEFRPLAKWKMKEGKMEAAKLEYLGEDNMKNIVKDLSYIDQLTQDASGVTRQFQGAAPAFERQETLGQTEIKMAAAEKRFMKIAQEVTEDYVLGVVEKTFKIITNPAFVKKFQKLLDKKLGMIENEVVINSTDPDFDEENPQVVKESVSRVDLSSLGKMHLDFMPIGIVNFIQKTEIPQQMRDVLNFMKEDPSSNLILAKERIYERLFQSSGIDDYQGLFRSKGEREDMKKVLEASQNDLEQQSQGAPQ